jgi:trimethylamine--corrinoid protein Co-methyltransferase
MRNNLTVNVTPQLRVLSEGQIEELHLGTLEVLRRTGTRVLVPEARDMLKKAGCWVDGDRVRYPAGLVEWAIRAAPSRVVLCDREGRPAMYLEDGRSYFGTGSDTPNVIDPYTGERRQSRLEDVARMARLVDGLPNIDFLMCMAIAQDIDQTYSDLYHFRAMVENTTKPICYTAWNLRNLQAIIEMCEAVAGGAEAFQRNPFAILYAEPISPLQHIVEGTTKLIYTAQKGLPIVYTPGMMFGAAAPITSAGGLLVANAELLSGLVICQLAREGNGFVYGGGVTVMDMRTMNVTYASPEFLINMVALTELSHHYGLPVFSFGACSDSKTFDQQAALEGGLWTLLAALAGGNLCHDVGYIESGLTASMDMVVMADEVIGMVRRIMEGITVTPETLAIDVIDEIGPGGQFFAHPHTGRHVRENWFPRLLDRDNYDAWTAAGKRTLGDKTRRRVLEILEQHEPKPLEPAIRAKLDAIIARMEQHS